MITVQNSFNIKKIIIYIIITLYDILCIHSNLHWLENCKFINKFLLYIFVFAKLLDIKQVDNVLNKINSLWFLCLASDVLRRI